MFGAVSLMVEPRSDSCMGGRGWNPKLISQHTDRIAIPLPPRSGESPPYSRCTMPWRTALMAASVRSRTLSLANNVFRCDLTVSSDI